eukprot:TRINITY_DN2581_c0_g1_i2.p1 TRINITY_DN2581_c0_g1~~TRINITY_DN2581_c0_g1_i2.p1  ORF type:complete len:265 (+),score=24.37 TRINITY_DN2581_c0_g1_i2:743-1537(+)
MSLLSDQRSRSSSLTMNHSPPYMGINEVVKPAFYHAPVAPRERAHSFTTSHQLQYEPMQTYHETTQELHNPFLRNISQHQMQPPAYSEYKRMSVLHTYSDPYGTLSTCNSTVVQQHNAPPLSAGPLQPQYMTRPNTSIFEYEIEHKILDTQHPRVQDIKRESVGELPATSSPSCFQLNTFQGQHFERTFSQTNCPTVKEEQSLVYKNSSCQHAATELFPTHQQIDLKSLQPTLLSDQVSINTIEKDVNFEMLDSQLRVQTVPNV